MIIELGIATGAGMFIGYGICAALTARKVADSNYAADCMDDAFVEASKAHTRCADALTTVQGKIEDIRELLNRPRTIRKKELAAILDGDQ